VIAAVKKGTKLVNKSVTMNFAFMAIEVDSKIPFEVVGSSAGCNNLSDLSLATSQPLISHTKVDMQKRLHGRA
jgi:hypothetical protein